MFKSQTTLLDHVYNMTKLDHTLSVFILMFMLSFVIHVSIKMCCRTWLVKLQVDLSKMLKKVENKNVVI